MKIQTLLSLAFIVVMFGCKNSAPVTPQGATGDLKGTVGLYDSHGNQLADKSGVMVQAEGTSLSAISDTAGNWIIQNLPTQTYTISFSKSGYGTVKNTSFPFIGGGTVLYGNRVYLYQPVTFTISLDSVSAVSDTSDTYYHYGYLAGHISGAELADSSIIQAYVIYGLSPNLDLHDTSTYLGGLLFNNERLTLHKRGSNLVFQSSDWEICAGKGWAKSGMKVYMQALAGTSQYSPSYYDIKTDKWIDPNPLPSSNVVMVKIP